MGVFAGPEVVEDGLVLALDAGNTKSYPGSGTTWTDLSGNGNTGTLVNGVGYSSANGGSLSFDGTNDYGYVSTSFPSYNNFTVSFWIKINTIDNHRGIFCIKNSSDTKDYTNGNYAIHTISGGYFGIEAGDLFAGNTSRNNTVINNTISHCTVVCDQSNSIVRYFLNGNLDGTETITSTITFNDHNLLFLGCRQYSTTGVNNFENPLNGTLFTYTLYNRALTASEIQQNFNATRGRFGI